MGGGPRGEEHGKQLEEVLIYLIERGLWLEQEVLVLAGGWQSWPLDAPCGQRSNENRHQAVLMVVSPFSGLFQLLILLSCWRFSPGGRRSSS